MGNEPHRLSSSFAMPFHAGDLDFATTNVPSITCFGKLLRPHGVTAVTTMLMG